MCRQTTRFFARLFNYSYFRNVYQLKIFTITYICPPNETLLRMLSLDFLDKVAKRVDFHSTTVLLLDFFDKDQTSLNIIRLHSTHSIRWPNGSIFCRVKYRVKNRTVLPGPNVFFRPTCEAVHGSCPVAFTLNIRLDMTAFFLNG